MPTCDAYCLKNQIDDVGICMHYITFILLQCLCNSLHNLVFKPDITGVLGRLLDGCILEEVFDLSEQYNQLVSIYPCIMVNSKNPVR